MSTYDDRFVVPAWCLSLGVHAVVIGLAVTLVAHVKPVLKEDVFQWEVALVEAINPEPVLEQPMTPAKPVQSIARTVPTEQPPETVVSRVAPQQSVQVVHPPVEPVKAIEQKLETVEHQVEAPQPLTEPEAVVQAVKEPTPIATAEPIVAESKTTASAPPVAAAVETRPTYQDPVDHAASNASSQEVTPQHQVTEARETPKAWESTSTPAIAGTQEAPVQVAKAVPSGPVDHRWLAESLWRRVGELKRYPSFARLNGLEGKVILKAIIRSDGHLAEVTVQKSSGHNVLDAAAMETVRLACPLHMKHAIGKPEIVVSLPIVYSLAN